MAVVRTLLCLPGDEGGEPNLMFDQRWSFSCPATGLSIPVKMVRTIERPGDDGAAISRGREEQNKVQASERGLSGEDPKCNNSYCTGLKAKEYDVINSF